MPAVLKNELDVDPSRQTVEAYERCLRMETPGVRAPLATPDPPIASAEADPPPAYAISAASNGVKTIAMTAKIRRTGLRRTKFRRAILTDSLQAPSTAIPLAIAAMALIYGLLIAPRTGWGPRCPGPVGGGGIRRGCVFHLALCHSL